MGSFRIHIAVETIEADRTGQDVQKLHIFPKVTGTVTLLQEHRQRLLGTDRTNLILLSPLQNADSPQWHYTVGIEPVLTIPRCTADQHTVL